MIVITRLDGSTLVVNADLIETIERHGDTVLTLVSGTRFVVRESIEEITDAVIRFRAGVLLSTEALGRPPGPPADDLSQDPGAGAAKVIPMSAGRRNGDHE